MALYVILCTCAAENIKDQITFEQRGGRNPFVGNLKEAKTLLGFCNKHYGYFGATYKLYELVKK